MELKNYQERVLAEVRTFLETLAVQRAKDDKHAMLDAWEACRLSGTPVRRRTGNGKDLPMFCIKAPTGAGKTLLATQILGLTYKTLLTAHNGAGLVLWVVPSDQIYKDTLKALRDRNHFYRQALEYGLSRRVEVWEKNEVTRLTPTQLASNLNVLLLKLQGTNRQDKETLKFFRDSGGNVVQHFPPEDAPEGHRALKERITNLEMLEEDPATGRYLAKTSVANLVRLCEPVVILDEGHKATSTMAQKTIEGFNPTLVVELSATPPKEANLLCKVTGDELLRESMIKLPINVENSGQTSWQNCLAEAKDQRDKLAEKALAYYRDGHRLIRPIVLVQVERTGKDQREPQFIHAEQVREFLTTRMGVPEDAVKVKSSETDDIEGIDLMSDDCPVEWIITKAALQEGWDCSFAYILVSLSNTKSKQAMTQLVGRVLRQPFVTKTPYHELNESYVYCLREAAAAVVTEIRHALQNEGYEGDVASVRDASGDGDSPATRIATMRMEFSSQYRRPFEGRIFLPQFCVKTGDQYEGLDYYQHLLSGVDVAAFDYERAASWDFTQDLRDAKIRFYQITLNPEALEPINLVEQDISVYESDASTKAWLVANLGMEWYSAKRLRRIVEAVCGRLQGVEDRLGLVRFRLLDKISAFIVEQTDLQTEARFRELYESGRLLFYLECHEARWEIPPQVECKKIKGMRRPDDSALQKNLFDFQPDEANEYEKAVALYLDKHPEVLWWYRNLVGRDEFSIKGYRKNRVYPDFVVQKGGNSKVRPEVLVVESKGRHLAGNTDTEYKRSLARYFDDLGKLVSWQELGEGFAEETFRFQVLDQGQYDDTAWQDDLQRLLTGSD